MPLTSYLAPFPNYGRLLVKFLLATGGRFTLMPSLGVIPANIWINFTLPETRMIVLADVENHTILSLFLWSKHDGLTERQTDRQPVTTTVDFIASNAHAVKIT